MVDAPREARRCEPRGGKPRVLGYQSLSNVSDLSIHEGLIPAGQNRGISAENGAVETDREGDFEDLCPAVQRVSRSGGSSGKHEAKPSAEKGKVWIEVWVGVWIEFRSAGNSDSLQYNHPISPQEKATLFSMSRLR